MYMYVGIGEEWNKQIGLCPYNLWATLCHVELTYNPVNWILPTTAARSLSVRGDRLSWREFDAPAFGDYTHW